MARRTTLCAVLAFLILGVLTRGADDKGKPIGRWERKVGETKVTFDVKADGMNVAIMDNSGNVIKVEATYTVKDGVVSGVVKKTEKVGVEGGPNQGDKFGFRFKIDKDVMTLSDLTGTDSDEAKQLVQGEYKKAK